MYAIVDIETTGGHAGAGAITEIAILLHDGRQIESAFHSLVNPEMRIPPYITSLTGISNEMVAEAPPFRAIAEKVKHHLSGRIFVAHNVNFDYSFIRHALVSAGLTWEAPKLCTVRLSRKIFPGLRSYSLGELCRSIQIPLNDRHRAMGDAQATAMLFQKLVEADQQGLINAMLKKGSRESYLPMHLPVSDIDKLPGQAGVYYFRDQKDKIIYVGKATNLQKRVVSHFSNNSTARKKQEMMRNVCRISYTLTGSAFTASILESLEIRKHWPKYNTSQKEIEFGFGIFRFEDQQGRSRLGIERLRRNSQPIMRTTLMADAHRTLWKLVREHRLCPVLCFLHKAAQCDDACEGICHGTESPADYNRKVTEAILQLQETKPSFAISDKGPTDQQKAWMLVEEGRFVGMGFLPASQEITRREQLRTLLTPYHDNAFVRQQLFAYAQQHPGHTLFFS